MRKDQRDEEKTIEEKQVRNEEVSFWNMAALARGVENRSGKYLGSRIKTV